MKKLLIIFGLSLLGSLAGFVAWHLNWIGFQHYTLKVGTWGFPLPLLWFWLFWIAVLFDGKLPVNHGPMITREDSPVEFWLGTILLGFVAVMGTLVWNFLC